MATAPGAPAAQEASSRETLPRVIAAATRYVSEYQKQLTYILADEVTSQHILAQTPIDRKMPRDRETHGEVFFIFADDAWMAIRDVAEVDGKRARDRVDIRKQLSTLPAARVAQTFKARNSRFNIGRIYRNFNEPTLPLLILTDEYRRGAEFALKDVERRDGADVATVAFRERGDDTLIRDLSLRPVASSGELVVDLESGAILRTAFRTQLKTVQTQLTTTYARDAKLDMWLPVTFVEEYEAGDESAEARRGSPGYEHVVCESTYSNFRRFETTWRIR